MRPTKLSRIMITAGARPATAMSLGAYGPRSGAALRAANRGALRLFVDTADRKEWEKWMPTGLFYGVTTNPTLLERAGERCTLDSVTDLAKFGFGLGCEEVQLQTWGGTVESFVDVGMRLAGIDPRIVVKVPVTREGIEAAARLIDNGVRVTMTGVYSAHQALSAAAVGADYAAPYLGRMNDSGKDGQAEIVMMQDIVDGAAKSDMRILVASLREATELSDLASQGLDTFTFSPAVAEQMFGVELTVNAAAAFEEAAVKMGASE